MSPRTYNTRSESSFNTLTSKDLTGFDKEARDMILEAMAAGCTGRISQRGHAILHNAAGDTTSVPRIMSTRNRTAQNSRSALKRFLAGHQQATRGTTVQPDSDPQLPSESGQLTIAQAFEQFPVPFMHFVDAQTGGVPADAKVTFSLDEQGEPVFQLITAPESEPTTGAEPESPAQLAEAKAAVESEPKLVPDHDNEARSEFICTDCGRSFDRAVALGAHRRSHRTAGQISIKQLAEINGIGRDVVRRRLRQIGAVRDNGDMDITPDNVKKAGLRMSTAGTDEHHQTRTPVEKPVQHTRPTTPEPKDSSESAGAPGDPAAILKRVREALGPDPRVAELEQRVEELTQQLDAEKKRADEATARLELIQEAFRA